MHHRGVGKDGQVLAFAADDGLSERHGVIRFGKLFFDAAVEEFVLEKEYGIVVANAGLEQALGVVGRRGIDDLEAGSVQEIHLRTERVKRPAMDAGASWPANGDGRRGVPKIVAAGDKVGELVETASDEVDELQFGDGAQPEEAHAAGGADDGAFAD